MMSKLIQYSRYLVLIMLICFFSKARGQNNKTYLHLKPMDDAALLFSQQNKDTLFDNPPAVLEYIARLPKSLQAKGYITSSVDSFFKIQDTFFVQLFLGEKYRWGSLSANESDWPVLNQAGIFQNEFSKKPFDPALVQETYEKLLDYFENNGYPFARVSLDSIIITNDLISGKLTVVPGQLYYLDTIHIKGNAKISNTFLWNFLNIQPHTLYNKSVLNAINKRLVELPYIQQTQAWEIRMLNTGAELNLFLENKKSNQVDLLVGLLPSGGTAGGKLLLTGEANLDIRNPFGYGETLALNWQQLQDKSPRLNLFFARPYIFKSPFGVNLGFQLYKKDSAYLNIQAQVGLQYVLSAKQSGTVYLKYTRTNLLEVDTLFVKSTHQLPDVIDLSSTGLVLQYDFNNTDYRFNPRKGNELQVQAGFGDKVIRKNNTILQLKDTGFNFENLYDTLQLKSYQVSFKTAAAHYFPLGKQSTIKTTFYGGIFQSPHYYLNELFQIGGYKILRGFDEESIYCNRYAVASFEYRYLLGQNSYLFGFTDLGYTHFENSLLQFNHTYIGVGGGIAFETNAGIFNISYAIGKRDDEKLDFRQSKIHIGFISLF